MSFGSRVSHPNQQQPAAPASGTVSLAVKGWASGPSKFAHNPTEGHSAILTWLNKRSQRPLLSHRFVGRGSAVLIIEINANDRPRFDHLNGFTFSGGTIIVEEANAPRNQQQPHNGAFNPPSGPRGDHRAPSGPINDQRIPSGPRGGHQNNTRTFGANNGGDLAMNGNPNTPADSSKAQLESILTNVIRKRYNANEQYLTLEALSADPDIVAAGLHTSSASKVFTAIFTIAEKYVFETAAKRRDMVISISISNNGLTTVGDIIALNSTFPNIKNLDLSKNQLTDAGSFKYWRNGMRNLEHLIITDNPIDANPAEKEKLVRWWRRLKMLNGAPVTRGQGGAANTMALDAPAGPGALNGNTPDRTNSPAPPFAFANQARPTQGHPEFPPDSMFGLPEPGKDEATLQKEQMGLRFSFETRLNMQMTEQCLVANGWDYDRARENLGELMGQGAIPAEAFLG
ncbi:uncharacterized protein HMPREF1541_08105 [Cyphellophora europaea CBS 101466]|uniref:TAP-C domain-containing protein n=1 Tax=Cyphellophora europaea (strain CBS 101466) TaxID=1220924 RepID=W2RLB7_CYPE1|nr:uncharacterized protein HMPREF1541_08105 [Cyphellophora europaea CBS 101466]ETN37115.1 hypothetical protein HMPREF1541_08105 [Cyphellophora europaea CBS 101466]